MRPVARPPTIEEVVNATSSFLRIPLDMITDTKSRTFDVTNARHLAVYIARKLTFKSFEQIADIIYKDSGNHKSVIAAFNKISILVRENDAQVKMQINGIKGELGL